MGTGRAILVGLVALAAFTSSVAFAQQAGGPGKPCTRDMECGACGWICSAARGLLCIPAFEGDVGSCAVDADCACAGQTCSAGQCIPLARTECRCDSDCPTGSHCNQLVFACQTSPCDKTNYVTQYNDGCQDGYLPPECADDLQCGVSVRGATCVPWDGGFGFCQSPSSGSIAWCRDTLDAGRPSTGCTYGSTSPISLGALLAVLAMYLTRRRRCWRR
jgi:LPXTG-motif cell wall-anchored protein